MTELQAREYGPDSSPDEIAAIAARLTMIRPGVVMYREVPVPSPFQIGVFAERLRSLTAGLASYDMILDLSASRPPGKRAREALRDFFNGAQGLRRVAVFTGKNFIIDGIARMLLKGSGVRDLTVCKDEPSALAAVANG